MATPAQKARIAKMNAARKEKREARAQAEELENQRFAQVSAPRKKAALKKAKQKATADNRADEVRRLKAKIAQLESENPPSGSDDSPQATVARARAKRRAASDPTVRRGEQEVMRDPRTGRVIAVGRDGKPITRMVSNGQDKFFIADKDVPDGWSYQWIAQTVAGEEQRNSIASFQMGGWSPVGMERYPGRYGPKFMKDGKLNTEQIVIDGLGLYERPKVLTQEARAEEVETARSLIRTRNEQFVPKLPEARSARMRGTELRAKRSIEGMPGDIAPPSYQIDVDAGLDA